MSRANAKTNSECKDQDKNALDWSSPCGKLYISPWPYCPGKVNWTSEDQNIILEEVRQLILHGFDSNSCNFAHDEHDDSQLLQNLLASLYLVNKFFSFKKPPTKSDFMITFGGVSATLNLSLARSDWWAHVANPKESSLYQRTILMAEFFNDKDLILVSTDNEPGHTADGVVCAGKHLAPVIKILQLLTRSCINLHFLSLLMKVLMKHMTFIFHLTRFS